METVRLTIEKLVFEGYGLARHEGWVHFVEGGLPGETVEAGVLARRRRFVETRALRILEPSSARRAPDCPSFGRCGGCHLLHLAYPAQLEAKLGFLREALHFVPDLGARLSPVTPSPREFDFRNKLELTVGPDARGGRVAGFHERGNPRVLAPADACRLMSPDARDIIRRAARLPVAVPAAGARLLIRESRRTGQRLIRWTGLRRSDTEVCRAGIGPCGTTLMAADERSPRTVCLTGDGRIAERLDRFEFELGPDTFFQTNTEQAEQLFRAVGAIARQAAPKKALDLYAGVGVIAAYLADAAREVIAVEAAPDSVAAARRNLARNGLAETVRVCAAEVGRRLPETTGGADLIVVDPPRAGLSADARAMLLAARPRDLIYISCHPATLGRDLRLLLDGGYAVEAVRPFDMFPQSFHVETLAHLRWGASG